MRVLGSDPEICMDAVVCRQGESCAVSRDVCATPVSRRQYGGMNAEQRRSVAKDAQRQGVVASKLISLNAPRGADSHKSVLG